ncbi:hypothetical protein PGT21_002293 [Puccinia graminis f. sp. tritici]|uniref:Secreted protein n=1 Tax=Puccinia graminis f. sp. tritici TaxID=56615 RepID=A0A5B0QM29_PUCGR|nr:hypothetical protein PGT21_002293 [Puccinia graminis f. sp. tritici]
MFLKDWSLQRPYIICAVIALTLLPSVQLSESREHSLVRRGVTHNCDVQYVNTPSSPDAKCVGNDHVSYSCAKESCTEDFEFKNCQLINPHNPNALLGNGRFFKPDSYATGPHYIKALSGDTLKGCPYSDNPQRQSCNLCVLR